MARPRLDSEGQVELDKLDDQIESTMKENKEIMENVSKIKTEERAPQREMSQWEKENAKEIHLKPTRSIADRVKFDEKWRKDFNFDMEEVCFMAENHEVIGEDITLWTKKYPGQPAQEWCIPVNKPVWGPRLLAEQLLNCKYSVFVQKDTAQLGNDYAGSYHGTIAVEKRVERLTARPVTQQKSLFSGF